MPKLKQLYLPALALLVFLTGKAQVADTSLIFYEAGVKAFNQKKYKLADSLFTRSIHLVPHPDTYFNRANCRDKVGDKKGYCEDICAAATLGDKEALSLFVKECGKVDTTYTNANGEPVKASSHANRSVNYKSEYVNANIAVKYDSLGNFLKSIVIEDAPDSVRTVIDQPPEYPGGTIAMQKFMRSNTRYPEEAFQNGIQGTVFLKFIVNKLGYVEDIRIVKGIRDCPDCDKEAVRVVTGMPRWKPAVLNGEKVRSWFNLPFSFKIQ